MASGRRERGFALLITVTLLAFLVLLLVSLAALTRVETQVAGNHQNLEQARQNALMALNIAIGQLQKYAGPDARVTAESAITSTVPIINPHYAGVWIVKPDGTVNPASDMWLVSGSEQSTATAAGLLSAGLDPSNDTVAADQVFLVGDHSVALNAASSTAPEKAGRVKLTKQDIKAVAGSVPGLGAAATPVVGRYAWWVGDQGVKASLALPDRADEVKYAPWYDGSLMTGYDQRARIRQQIGSGANYFRDNTATTAYQIGGFDPLTVGQLANVKLETQVGLWDDTGAVTTYWHGHYHDFTTSANAVLANTLPLGNANAGLMHDLSLKPDELGDAFKAYANYASYMETPGQVNTDYPVSPAISDVSSPRRRYNISIPVESKSTDVIPNLAFDVAPVVTELMVQFSVEYATGSLYKVGTKIYTGLWNPYTSAIIPPSDLFITISGFPEITIFNHAGTSSALVDLQGAMPAMIKDTGSGGMRLYLPFMAGPQADTTSWFPGRIYGWTTKSSSDGVIDNQLKFYNKTMTSVQRWYYDTGPMPGGSSGVGVTVPAMAGLTIELRNSKGVLATYTTPSFSGFTIPADPTPGTKWFAYACRLRQASNADKDRTWLKKFDPRSNTLAASSFGPFDPTLDTSPTTLTPSVYNISGQNTVQSGFLIYRIQGHSDAADFSSYNDAPLFELPRLPLLSVGELQHMQITGSRPFAIGNSWGGDANSIFDRFFFSGLSAAIPAGAPDLSANQPLPNWNLKIMNANDMTTVKTAAALSSQYLLQAGGFNINSTSVAAWRAVLSSVRFKQSGEFQGADIDNTTSPSVAGTQKPANATIAERFNSDATLGVNVAAPAFFRFPQSAQETYFWQAPAPPTSNVRMFDTYGFRLGVRGNNLSTSSVASTVMAQRLTTDQIEAVATEIVGQLRQRATIKGPFRSMLEFLKPLSGADDGTPSLLETAISNSGLNPAAVQPLDTVASLNDFGLCSLTLTQADIVAALAPFLRARSDTFTVRSYGEIINPVTAEVAGRAWLEATVQRVPETVDGGDIQKAAGTFGRRFKIISFRWLSPSDI